MEPADDHSAEMQDAIGEAQFVAEVFSKFVPRCDGLPDTAVNRALLLNACRQQQLLRCCIALADVREPSGTYIIQRTMYEILLYSLLFAYHAGAIPTQDLTKAAKKWLTNPVTAESLAKRFLEYRRYVQLDLYLSKMEGDAERRARARSEGRDEASFIIDCDRWAAERQTLATQHSFSRRDGWSPFLSIGALTNHLSPNKPSPLVPLKLLGPLHWDDLHHVFYRFGNHFVHGSPAASVLRRTAESQQAWYSDTSPREDSHALLQAFWMAAATTQVFCETTGLEELWEQTAKKHQTERQVEV